MTYMNYNLYELVSVFPDIGSTDVFLTPFNIYSLCVWVVIADGPGIKDTFFLMT